MSVTYPSGFRAAGVTAGVKPSGAPDLALLVADAPATAAGVFTTNAFRAAPVELSVRRLADGAARAVVVNSGQANAATGAAGVRDAALAARAASLAEIALAACERRSFCGAADLDTARAFLRRFTLRGRSPGDDQRPEADAAAGSPAQPPERRRARRSKTTSPFRIM